MSGHKDVNDTVHYLLNAPYPFNHQHYKKLYEKCEKLPANNALVMYHCNICQLKLLGDKQLSDHNGCFSHELEMKKLIDEMLRKPRINDGEKHSDTVNSGHMSRMAKKMLRNAAINASKMKLTEEWAKLQNDYDEHKQNPCSHPMYAKEWNIFYYRTMGDLIAANKYTDSYDFTQHWQTYWAQRINVYFDKDRRKILENIAANYRCTVFNTDVSDESSNDAKHKAFRAPRSLSSHSDAVNSTDSSNSNGPSNDKNIVCSDMDLSNGSHTDNDCDTAIVETVSSNHAPTSTESPMSNGQSRNDLKPTKPTGTPKKAECISFDQSTVDIAVMKTVLQYLDRYKMSPDQLSDEQLRSCIESVIAGAPYHLNLRSASAESDKYHSR